MLVEEISKTITITGTIRDEHDVLPGANIFFKGSNTNVQADFDGNFSIEIPTNNTNVAYTLVVSYIGYINKKIIVSDYKKDINIVLTENDEMMLGEIVVTEYKSNIFTRIGKVFKRK